jgi:hypothetical protein
MVTCKPARDTWDTFFPLYLFRELAQFQQT